MAGRIGTKPPMLAVSTPAVVATLEQLSKAALIDLVADACATANGSGDTPPTVAQVLEFIDPVVFMRGDKVKWTPAMLAADRTPLEEAADEAFAPAGARMVAAIVAAVEAEIRKTGDDAAAGTDAGTDGEVMR